MTALRDHAIFTIVVSTDRKDRIEDDLGDLKGFGPAYSEAQTVRVVAPSRLVAEAWVITRFGIRNPRIESVEEQKLDGFVQDHIW